MKALTIKQPWLYCITHLDKRVENRTWAPYSQSIGVRIALHSSARIDKNDLSTASILAGQHLRQEDMALGSIVATAVIIRVVTQHTNKWFFGPYGWILDDVKVLDAPIPCRGALGFWAVPPEIAEAIQ